MLDLASLIPSTRNPHPKLAEVAQIIRSASGSLSLQENHFNEVYQTEEQQPIFAHLVLWSAELGLGANEMSVDLAAAVELLYLATQAHLIVKEDLQETALLANYLQCQGFSLIHSYDRYVAEQILDSFKLLISGQYNEIISDASNNQSEEHYLERLYKKRASFTATCCKLGAISGHSSQQCLEAATGFGFALGMAHQIKLDLIQFIRISSEVRIAVKKEGTQVSFGWRIFQRYVRKAAAFLQSLPDCLAKQELMNLLSLIGDPPKP